MSNERATTENDESANAGERHPGLANCRDASLDSGISLSRRSSQATLADAIDHKTSTFSWWRNLLFCLFPFCRHIDNESKVVESESHRDHLNLTDKTGCVNLALACLDQCMDAESSTDGDPKNTNATINECQEKARSNRYTKRDEPLKDQQNNGSEGRNDTDSGFQSRPVSQILSDEQLQFSLAPIDGGIDMSKQDAKIMEDTRVMDKETANRSQLPDTSTCDNVEKNARSESSRYQHTNENTMGVQEEETYKKDTREIEKMPETSTCDSSEKVDELSMIVQKILKVKEKHARSHEELQRIQIHLKNFAAGFLTTEYGGKLTISGKDVSLHVPPGALPDRDEPQLVYIYIRSSEEDAISKDCREAWVTPQVVCGPPGLVFLEPVRLTMPCLFALDLAKLQVSAYKKKRLTGNTLRGLRDGEDVTIVASDQNVTLLLKHFCKIGCTAQAISSKWVRAAVFVEQLKEEKHRVSLEFFDLNEKHHEVNSPQKCLRSSTLFLINESGGAVHVTINGVECSWKLSENSHQSISSTDIWEYQSCTKHARPQANFFVDSTDSANPFSAHIDVYQDKNSCPRITLCISPDTSPHRKAKSLNHEEMEQNINHQFLAPFFRANTLFKRQDCYFGACVSLDIGGDQDGWKQLADRTRFGDWQMLKWFEKFAPNNRSPSDMILEDFFRATTSENMSERLCYLSNLLSGINTPAKQCIDREIKARSRSESPTQDQEGGERWNSNVAIDSEQFYPAQGSEKHTKSDMSKQHCFRHKTGMVTHKQVPASETNRNRDSGIGSRPNSSYSYINHHDHDTSDMTLATPSEELQNIF